VAARLSPRGSELAVLRQAGSLRALFPAPAGGALQAAMINTAGGITGGDRFFIEAEAAAGAALTLTTQAAERAYRAQPGETGRLSTRLTVAGGARLDWLPQETILYRGCALERTLTAELAPDARLLLAEPVIFGRGAMGERLDTASFRDRIEIRRGGRLLLRDGWRLAGDVAAQLDRPQVAGGAGAMASVLYLAPDAEAQLPRLRAMLPETAGASLVEPDLLYLRLLAPDGWLLRAALVPILTRLHRGPLPRPWML
jgi:urease accessory protein